MTATTLQRPIFLSLKSNIVVNPKDKTLPLYNTQGTVAAFRTRPQSVVDTLHVQSAIILSD